MTEPKHALSASDVERFCVLCGWAYETRLNYLGLFDNNPRHDELMKSVAGKELERLSIICHEYGLLQIVKLDDKADMNGNFSLGIDYVLKYGVWSDPVRSRLEELAKELKDFASKLHDARNKIVSHNDRATSEKNVPLGMFDIGADEKYFNALQEFVNTVHGEVIGGPWLFSDLVKEDVAAFLATIKP